MIAIKNQSGSIAIRFLSQNRIPVLPVKPMDGFSRAKKQKLLLLRQLHLLRKHALP
jgi:hypothetical protein